MHESNDGLLCPEVKFRFVGQSKALPMGELARRKAATEREIRYKTLSVSPFGLPPLPKGEALVRCKLAAKSEFDGEKDGGFFGIQVESQGGIRLES